MSIRRSSLWRSGTAEAGAPAREAPGLREIRDAVHGKPSRVSRAHAIELLASSDFPNRHRDLAAVLEDDGAPSKLRYLAAMALARTDARAAQQILVQAARIRDDRVLTGVLRSLGQVGGRDALAAIERALPYAEGTALKQAEFASTLIAHRLGLEGHGTPEAEPAELLELPPGAGRSLHIRPAIRAEAERCLRSLGPRPYGIELAERPMYDWRCDRCRGMLLLNREFSGDAALDMAGRRKALFAIGALYDEPAGEYSVGALFLSAPERGGKRILISVHLTNGDRLFVGGAAVRGGIASWSLRAVKRLGAFPIRAEGEFRAGRLRFREAASGTRVVEKARPQQITPGGGPPPSAGQQGAQWKGG